ncbi:WG repeat-containing protein [Gemmiger sp.]
MKKVLSPLLSVLFLAGCAAGADASDAQPTVTPETSATAECAESAETSETAPTPNAPQGLVPTGAAVLDYDEIRLLRYSRELQPYPEVEYYTMCRDGKWGLMRSDGSEVLPCRALEPLYECGLGHRHWHDYIESLSWEDTDTLRKEYAGQLQANGDGVICDGHDGDGYLEFVYLPDENTLYTYRGSLGPGDLIAPTDDDLLLYSGSLNGPVPARTVHVVERSEGWCDISGEEQYIYRRSDGTAANDFTYTAADFFFDAPLAPAQRDGKWVYLDVTGREVTEPCYDSVYASDSYTGEPPVYRRAAPLLNGYAPVSRDGKFGLLDSTGAEFVPCVYDGLVWDGGTAWIKLSDGWHEYTIPGVTKPDPLADLPESIAAPDTRPTRTDIVFFSVDTAGERLNVRTGPGLEYDILDKLSDSAQVRLYGTMSTAPGWALVKYGRQFGWVSQDFLVLER